MASISYLQVRLGATSVRAQIVMENTGGVVSNIPTSLIYFRDGDTVSTTVAVTAGTLGTWASATATLITGTTGCYEVGIPNAVFANAARQVTVQFLGAGPSDAMLQIQIVPNDVVSGVTVFGNVTVGGYAANQDPYTSVMKTVDSVDALTNADTLEKRIRIILSALLGKVSGMGASAPIFRNITDTKARITATTDTIGDRTAVTLDGS